MNRDTVCMLILTMSFGAAQVKADTQSLWIRSEPQVITESQWADFEKHIDLSAARIENPEGARNIISRLVEKSDKRGAPPENFSCIIHVLRWEDVAESDRQKPGPQHWYVYSDQQGKWSQEDFTSRKRLYGVKRFYMLYLHLNGVGEFANYFARYEIDIRKKTPAYLNHLAGLMGVFSKRPKEESIVKRRRYHYWGWHQVDVEYVPSDITITSSIIRPETPETKEELTKPLTFDNEGLYFLDFSVGVPIRRIRQLEFDTANNMVREKEVDQQNMLALVNIHPKPVDVKGSNLSWIPHFVGGVAIASQPLHKILLAGGWGPYFAHFYVGVLLV